MIFQLFSGLLIILGILWYFLYFEPKKRVQAYAEYAEKLGYKVKLMPFSFLNYYLIKCLTQDDKSLRVFKQELTKYDLLVGNLLTQLAILPINQTMLKDVFNQSSKLPKHPYITQAFQTLSSGGVPFTEGDIWKRKRKIISSVFHFDFLNSMIPVIKEELDTQIIKIDKMIEENQKVDIQKSLIKILSSVVAKCFFGTNMEEYQIEGIPYSDFYVEYLDQLADYVDQWEYVVFRMKFFKYGLTKKGRSLKKKYDILFSIAKEVTLNELNRVKNKTTTKKNLVSSLYESGLIEQTSKKNSEQYSIQQYVGEFFAFFGAGTDTTANTINLILHYLGMSQNEKYLKKIRQELTEINKLDASDPDKLKNMKWMQAVFNQSLRINGPAAGLFNRLTTEDIKIGQLEVPKNTQVSIFTTINHYKPENFKNPFEFNPERFYQNQPIVPFSFLPFGAGQRNCLGQYLSKIQAKVVLSKFIERYDFKPIDPINMKLGFVYSNQSRLFEMKKIQI